MSRGICEPFLQHLGNDVTDRTALLTTPVAQLLNQRPGKIDRKDSSTLRYGTQAEIASGLQ
jgi:hypothetical protein